VLTVERLQVMLDKDLYEELCRRSLDEGVSKAELVRRAVRAAYPPIDLPPIEEDPLFKLFGLVSDPPDDLPTDWSVNHDHDLHGGPKKDPPTGFDHDLRPDGPEADADG
jgi:hypothetical protein